MTRKQKRNLIRIIISAVLLAAAIIVCRFVAMPWWAELIMFLAPYLTVGYDVLKKAFLNMIHGQIFDENFLMSLATIGAFAIREYPEAAFVMLFYQVGELFQSIAVGKSRKSIAGLMSIRPDHANVIRGGEEISVSPDEVMHGEEIVIRSGERVPLDGVVLEGSTSLNMAVLTGESAPRDVTVGENVISGSVNMTGLIRVKTTGTYTDSTVNKVLELVERSAERKSKQENFITKFAKWYTPAVVVSAVLLALVPPLLFRGGWIEWLKRALIFLVVSCPCALVISVPLSFFCGMGGASKKGVLVKGSNFLDALSKVGAVVFDKTGTLTRGSFEVTKVHTHSMGRAELVDIAAMAESFSNHPIAGSIVRAHGGHIDKARIGEVKELAGLGIEAEIDGRNVLAGNRRLMLERGITPVCHDGCEGEGEGTCVHIAADGEYCGHIIISDEPKESSKNAIAKLRSAGVKTVMLTGDSEYAAEKVGKELGLDEVHSNLLPQDKVELVEKMLENKGRRTLAFVGDGINDAPVLSRADVGIAMGALGSDAAIEAADIVIADDDPEKVFTALNISKRTMRIVRENIAFALIVKLAVLVLGAFGIANMWIAVFADVGVAVIAVLNAIRAMKS